MQVIINDVNIVVDGYIPIPEEFAVQFYKDKSDLDYIPPIKIDADLLSDFGKSILCSRKRGIIMADIELVIKIPKFIYDQILKSHVSKKTIAKIFSNSTILPKGHGRLIDAKVAYKKFYSNNMAKVAEEILNEVPPIIEADKEEE